MIKSCYAAPYLIHIVPCVKNENPRLCDGDAIFLILASSWLPSNGGFSFGTYPDHLHRDACRLFDEAHIALRVFRQLFE